MERYLIAIDLDGTLLYDFDTIDESLAGFLRDFGKTGHKLVIATGRPYRSSRFIYDRFELDTPIINYNGLLVTNPKDPNFPEINFTVPKEVIIDIFQHCQEHLRNGFSEVGDHIHLLREENAIEPLLHRANDTVVTVGNLADTLKEDPHGCILIGWQGHGKAIEEYITTKYQGQVLCRIWNLSGEFDSIVEVFTPESNKGMALEHVAKYYGFERDHIIAIGDGHNDIEMITYAGEGIAVQNAHPELIEVASRTLPWGPRDKAIQKYLEERFPQSKHAE